MKGSLEMNNFKLTYICKNDIRDITSITSNWSRSDNINSLGMEFNFDLMSNPKDKYYKDGKLQNGGKIVFENNGVKVFQGIIKDIGRRGLAQNSYTAYDYGYYLNKDEIFMQFNKVSASDALNRICERKGIPIGVITTIPTSITKIYNGTKISEAIKDILKQATDETGVKYRLEMRGGLLCIEPYTNLIMTGYYKPASTLDKFDISKVPSDFSATYSITDMVNKVVVISSSEKSTQILAQASDDASITTFGGLTYYEKVDKKNQSQASQIAKTKLAELNIVKEEQNITLFGDDNVRAGRILVFNQPDIDMVGKFLLENCTHTYSNKNHFMKCKFKRVI